MLVLLLELFNSLICAKNKSLKVYFYVWVLSLGAWGNHPVILFTASTDLIAAYGEPVVIIYALYLFISYHHQICSTENTIKITAKMTVTVRP